MNPRKDNRRLLITGHLLVTAGLCLILLWPMAPTVVARVFNGMGAVLLKRTLEAPDLPPETRNARLTRAGRWFQKALAWDPLNGRAYANLATVYEAWHDIPSAARALSRAASLLPQDSDVHLRLTRARQALTSGP
jgi:cytochrome c-type biogenesis protein CcmH/NrfG